MMKPPSEGEAHLHKGATDGDHHEKCDFGANASKLNVSRQFYIQLYDVLLSCGLSLSGKFVLF